MQSKKGVPSHSICKGAAMSTFTWVVIIIAVLILLAVGGLATLIKFVKAKKEEPDPKPDPKAASDKSEWYKHPVMISLGVWALINTMLFIASFIGEPATSFWAYWSSNKALLMVITLTIMAATFIYQKTKKKALVAVIIGVAVFALISSLTTTETAVEAKHIFDQAVDIAKQGQIQTGQPGWEVWKKLHPVGGEKYPATDPETGGPYVVATARCTVKEGQWSPPLDLKKYAKYHFEDGQHCLPPGYKYSLSSRVEHGQPNGAGGVKRVNQNPKWMVPLPTPSGTEYPWIKDGVKVPDFVEFQSDGGDWIFVESIRIMPKGAVPTKKE